MDKLTYKLFYSVNEISQDWDNFGTDTFLQLPYLTAQENASPKNIDYFYVAVIHKNKIIGKCVVQRLRLKGKELFPSDTSKLKEELLNLLNLNMLCVGNIKLTGEHAWELNEDLDEKSFLNLLHIALDEIRKISKQEKKPVKLLLIKDFYAQNLSNVQKHFSDYESFSVQPNMVFKRDDAWQNFDGYLLAMRKKYRTRAKRAFKKADDIAFRALHLEEVIALQKEIYDLYLNVLANVDFTMYQLPENFFVEMKRQMPKDFNVFGGFHAGKLVCFYSIIENGKQLEAGFLGYDINIQQDKQLYLNMLYRMVDDAISNQFDGIDFSRTAMEIKSSVGAKPYDMYGLLKHTHPLMNRMLRSTFRKFYQKEEWVQRHPFKDSE